MSNAFVLMQAKMHSLFTLANSFSQRICMFLPWPLTCDFCLDWDVLLKSSFLNMRTMWVLRRHQCLTYCYAVATVNSLIMLGQGIPHIHFALGPAKSLASLGGDAQAAVRKHRRQEEWQCNPGVEAPGKSQECLNWPEGAFLRGKLETRESTCRGALLDGETGSEKGRFAKEFSEVRTIRFMLGKLPERPYLTQRQQRRRLCLLEPASSQRVKPITGKICPLCSCAMGWTMSFPHLFFPSTNIYWVSNMHILCFFFPERFQRWQ